jgi:hypothetical protein
LPTSQEPSLHPTTPTPWKTKHKRPRPRHASRWPVRARQPTHRSAPRPSDPWHSLWTYQRRLVGSRTDKEDSERAARGRSPRNQRLEKGRPFNPRMRTAIAHGDQTKASQIESSQCQTDS